MGKSDGWDADTEEMASCLGLILGIPLVVGILFGAYYLITWLLVVVLGGFGVDAPFWPTFGAMSLVSLLCSWIRRS